MFNLAKSYIEELLNSKALSQSKVLGYPNLSNTLSKHEMTVSEVLLGKAFNTANLLNISTQDNIYIDFLHLLQ